MPNRSNVFSFSHFAFHIPKGMSKKPPVSFALVSHIRSGSRVGITGIGGLGHSGMQWARALGAEVIAISHLEGRREDAQKLGAQNYLEICDTAKASV
ncbi:hypothetical protein BC937DRAFT_89338 [Endogone sp. FLAS-F59071]|nr:hypothetical protein BC937DRAFT_89338 [Endogone sp. FLAS-F59071]|eukprot:RUS17933.1 hypothetical protein BC937DRAFT_89338 [Endogone sp. FLAS-F59071]